MTKPLTIRPALERELPQLKDLIERSSWGLCKKDYDDAQIAAALEGAWGVDTQLVADETYLVVESAGTIVGCGGWSYRETLFGGNAYTNRDPRPLDPGTEPARIRAFFVAPDAAGRGVGEALLAACEGAAREAGFTTFTLMATLTGARFYARHGYQPVADRVFDLGTDQVHVPFVEMVKGG